MLTAKLNKPMFASYPFLQSFLPRAQRAAMESRTETRRGATPITTDAPVMGRERFSLRKFLLLFRHLVQHHCSKAEDVVNLPIVQELFK